MFLEDFPPLVALGRGIPDGFLRCTGRTPNDLGPWACEASVGPAGLPFALLGFGLPCLAWSSHAAVAAALCH